MDEERLLSAVESMVYCLERINEKLEKLVEVMKR